MRIQWLEWIECSICLSDEVRWKLFEQSVKNKEFSLSGEISFSSKYQIKRILQSIELISNL